MLTQPLIEKLFSDSAAKIEFDTKEAHSALYDTRKTAELFCYIVNRYQSLGGWPLVIDNVDEDVGDEI